MRIGSHRAPNGAALDAQRKVMEVLAKTRAERQVADDSLTERELDEAARHYERGPTE